MVEPRTQHIRGASDQLLFTDLGTVIDQYESVKYKGELLRLWDIKTYQHLSNPRTTSLPRDFSLQMLSFRIRHSTSLSLNSGSLRILGLPLLFFLSFLHLHPIPVELTLIVDVLSAIVTPARYMPHCPLPLPFHPPRLALIPTSYPTSDLRRRLLP